MPASRLAGLIRASLVAVASIASSPGVAMDLPSLIARTEGATRATVFLVPPMALFRASLDEAHMQAASCRYTTADPVALRALATLVRGGKVDASIVYQRPDLREGIYLTLADGSQLKVLLQDNNGGRLPVIGIAESTVGGDIQRIAVTAGETIATDLRRWVSRWVAEGTGTACDRMLPKPVAP